MASGVYQPVGRGAAEAALQHQQQLGPLGEVAGLEAPGPEDVGLVVAVVVPVGRPVGAVVLPDQAAGERRLALGDGSRQRQRTGQVASLAGGGVRGQHRFAGVHVGVLAAVGADLPVGRGLIGVEAVGRLPEAALHQLERGGDAFACARHAGLGRVRVGQQHEGQAVAVVGAVGDGCAAVVPVQHPGVAALRLCVRLVHEGQCVRHVAHRGAEPAPGQRVVEDEARAADEVACAAVVDRAVVLEKLEAAAGVVPDAGRVERQRVAHVGPQRVGAAHVGNGHFSTSVFRKRVSSSAICACTSMRGWAQANASKR